MSCATGRPGREPSCGASRLALWAAFFGDPELALQTLGEERNIERRLASAIALWRPIMRDVRRLPARARVGLRRLLSEVRMGRSLQARQ